MLSDLLKAVPADTLLQALVDALTVRSYPVTDWESGGVLRTLLEVEAATLADLYKLVPVIAGSGFLQYAAGAWLDELALSEYNLTRKPSSFTVDTLTLTNTGTTPYTLRPGDIWVASANGLRFSSLDGGIIPAAGSLSIRVEAEHPGSAYNLPRNTLTVLMTPFPGVTASNSGALVAAGVDTETDDQLRLRCRLRWAELGGGATKSAYQFWALTSFSSISKALVLDQHPRGQGTVDVLVWSEGGIGSDAVAAADAYIQLRRPVTADVRVYSATEVIQPVNLRVQVAPELRTTVQAQITAAIAALQRSIPIGGILYRAALYEQAMLPAGVVNVIVDSPAADLALETHQALTINLTVNWL
ncbi:baseplate J/gp47 family protein [Deinococcus radiomollis]|uniref:baseplate J/gp47 family protein n=1 Tax=Deinococcus radiomollis TaxID=468916 RepID=UPI003891787B